MAVANLPALPLGASSEGVRQGRCARVLFNSADRPRKKIITNLNDLFYVFTSYSTSNAPKTMELRFPRAYRSSHLPSILPSVAAASFWLVVAFKIIDQRPFKATVYFILYIFCRFIHRPKRWDGVPLRAPHPACLRSNTPPTASTDYRVDCCLKSPNGGHLSSVFCSRQEFLCQVWKKSVLFVIGVIYLLFLRIFSFAISYQLPSFFFNF